MSQKNQKTQKLEKALQRLVFDAERVSNKYGHDDDGKPSDWTEWTDLRNAIQKAKELLP